MSSLLTCLTYISRRRDILGSHVFLSNNTLIPQERIAFLLTSKVEIGRGANCIDIVLNFSCDLKIWIKYLPVWCLLDLHRSIAWFIIVSSFPISLNVWTGMDDMILAGPKIKHMKKHQEDCTAEINYFIVHNEHTTNWQHGMIS